MVFGRRHAPDVKRSSIFVGDAIEARSIAAWHVVSGADVRRNRGPTRGTKRVTKDARTIGIGSGRTSNGGGQ
jgi:hypothetical protein